MISLSFSSFRCGVALLTWGAVVGLGLSLSGHASPADPEKKSQLDPVGGGIAVFPASQEERWVWKLPEGAFPAAATGLQWTLRYWDGTEQKGEGALAKPPTLAFTPTKLGWARLTARFVDAKGAALLSEETTLTVGEADRTKARAFHYGFCAHTSWLKEEERIRSSLGMLAASGADILRDGSGWGEIEPVEGQWHFEKFDRLVKDCAEAGIEVQSLLGFTAQWASASASDANAKDWHQWNNKMPRLKPWLDYVQAMVGRYRDRVHYWEIWNEPDHSFWLDTPENHLLLFNKTAEAIRQADPSAHVMNGGLTFINTDQDTAVRKGLFTGGDRANWDLFAYHSYMTLEQLLEKSREVDAALKGTGLETLPRWLNESGFHTLVPDGENAQVRALIEKISVAPALGIGAFVWYDLRDDGVLPDTTENRLGVVDFFYRPRPAFAAFQNLVRELASRHYFFPPSHSAPGPVSGNVWLEGYAGADEGAGEHRLVAWREGKGSSPVFLLWPEGSAFKGVDDAMGNPVEASRVGRYAVVPLGGDPVYIAFTGKAVYPAVASFLRLPAVIPALPGSSSSFTVGVHNPTEAPLQLVLKGTLGGSPLFEQGLTLPAGGDRDVAVSQTWPASAAVTGKIDLEVTFPVLGGSLHAALPYQSAQVIPQAGKGAKLTLVLNRRENVVNLAEGLAQAERDWKGAGDLSATASLDYDATALHLAFDVEDDIHFQTGNPFKLWEGDGLQIALKMNDGDLGYLQAELAFAPGKGPVTWVDKAPPGGHLSPGALPAEVTRTASREGTHTRYTIDFPWASFGLSGPPQSAFRFSFLANDNDGIGRKQWVELSPGIGTLQDPFLFPLFLCK